MQAIAAIKADGSKWVSKYARGGSARKQSARKFYIVIDSIQGHFASNGCDPDTLKTVFLKCLNPSLDIVCKYAYLSRWLQDSSAKNLQSACEHNKEEIIACADEVPGVSLHDLTAMIIC